MVTSNITHAFCDIYQIGKTGVRVSDSDPGFSASLPGGNSVLEPPDPIPNLEVKRLSADDSVEILHAKVGHCQALIQNPESDPRLGIFFALNSHLFC